MKPEIYAWVCDSKEGVLYFEDREAALARALDLQITAFQTNNTFRLLKFTNPEEIAVVDGRAKE